MKKLLCGVFNDAKADLDQYQILNEASGAPYAVDRSGNRLPGVITISHRMEAAFCAYSPDTSAGIGADLEWVEPKIDAFVEDYFTSAERVLFSQAHTEKFERICLAWSAKEAFMKAARTGLDVDPRGLQVEFSEHMTWEIPGWNTAYVRERNGGAAYAFWRLLDGYVFTLACLEKPASRLIEIKVPGE